MPNRSYNRFGTRAVNGCMTREPRGPGRANPPAKTASATARPSQSRRAVRLGSAAVLIVVLLAVAAGLLPLVVPGTLLERDARRLAAAVIFTASYVALAVGRVPGLAIDRAGVALVGASLMVACGALPLDEAYKAVDLDTLTLLLGMMILVANLRLSGFFAVAGGWIMRRAHRPLALLAAVTAIAGAFSAFLVNDAVCLVLAPLVIELTLTLRRNPVPYLLAVAMASNIGSTATITGNPQNMMIGSFSHISYVNFAAALAPAALFGLTLTVVLIALFHRREFTSGVRLTASSTPIRIHRVLMWRALAGTALVVALFFAGQPPAKVAIIVGGLLLLTRRVRSERVYARIDWSLLLMFAGLFIIVAGAEHSLLSGEVVAAAGRLHLDRLPVLSALTAILSNLVSNVPAVVVLRPFVDRLRDPEQAWLTVAMASTFAGNLTVLGSIANLIVVQRAAAGGVAIGLWDYCRVGVPLTLLTLLIGTFWLSIALAVNPT
jgi:Na+/H+ antiporter NhaD/arsenite permease-like protein